MWIFSHVHYISIGIWKCWFFGGEGKTEVPGEKPLGARTRTNNAREPTKPLAYSRFPPPFSMLLAIYCNFTNNRPTDIWLTKDGSKHTNHVLQSSQPITSRLNWQTTNSITRPSTNQDKDQRHDIYCRFTVHLTLMMTSAQVVETWVNVITNSPSQDYTHPDGHNLPTFDMIPGFKPFTVYYMSSTFNISVFNYTRY